MTNYPLRSDIFSESVEQEPIRKGFGRGLKRAGEDERVVALCADLTESTQISLFKETYPERFIEVGVAEQNLVTVASGLARAGKIPFTSSYAAFSPGRNWEQIRTTAALNDQPVKIIGSHAGISVGPDGATHQMLEDIALMRVLPNMVVVAPGDSIEAEKATLAIAQNNKPSYVRLARDKTPIFSTAESPFEIGKAYVLKEGSGEIVLCGTGTMTYELLVAANELEKLHISVTVLHVPTIKPLDTETILQATANAVLVVTAEEAQAAGGFGGAIAELLSERRPVRVLRFGMPDRFGESGEPRQLIKRFRLNGESMSLRILEHLNQTVG